MYGRICSAGCRDGGTARRWITLALLLALALSGCLPSVTPAPVPTPVILEASASAALMDLENVFYECARQQNVALILDEEGSSSSDSPAPLLLRWGMPSGWDGYAAVLGEDELAVVVNPASPLESISLTTARRVFTGRQRAWEGGASEGSASEGGEEPEIHVWGYPADSDIRQGFEANVLEEPLPEGAFFMAPGPAELRESVAADPSAVGFLPRRWVNSQVKALAIDDLDPTRLRMPVLALSPAEPVEPAAGWLLCVQEQAFNPGGGTEEEQNGN